MTNEKESTKMKKRSPKQQVFHKVDVAGLHLFLQTKDSVILLGTYKQGSHNAEYLAENTPEELNNQN